MRLPHSVQVEQPWLVREIAGDFTLDDGSLHGLIHVSWARKTDSLHAPRMAVYVKPRTWFGRMYLALIYPFRMLVVYPAIVRATKRRWERLHPSSSSPA